MFHRARAAPNRQCRRGQTFPNRAVVYLRARYLQTRPAPVRKPDARRYRPESSPSGYECAPSGRNETAQNPTAHYRPRYTPKDADRPSGRCDRAPSRWQYFADTRRCHSLPRSPNRHNLTNLHSRSSVVTHNARNFATAVRCAVVPSGQRRC